MPHQAVISSDLRHIWSCALVTHGGSCNCAKKGLVLTNPNQEIFDRAAELDQRRQDQIAEQIRIINRITKEREDLKQKVNGLLKDIERMRLAASPVEVEPDSGLEFRERKPLPE